MSKPRQNALFAFAFAALLLSKDVFASQFQVGPGSIKMVDSSRGSEYGYAYGPSIIYTNGTWHAYYCSTGTGDYDLDHVNHVTSNDLVHWSAPDMILASTGDLSTCDPSVVRFDAGDGPYYYLVYSGQQAYSDMPERDTVNFVARSASPYGPFQKYTKTGGVGSWSNPSGKPEPIVLPKNLKTKTYGAGQPTLVVRDGVVYQWYTDISISRSTKTMLTTSRDMIHWSEPVETNADSVSMDVKYDKQRGVFVLFYIMAQHHYTSQLEYRTSSDGIHWSPEMVDIVCDKACFPDWANNGGVSGDDQGHLIPGRTLVAFGAPFDLNPGYEENCDVGRRPFCRGYWDLYGVMLYDEKVGHGWNFTDYFPADWNQDGKPDLMVRSADGKLFLYPFADGRFSPPINVGHGWDFTHYLMADWNVDGTPDLLVRNAQGQLYLYPFLNGAFQSPTLVGNGWDFTHYFVADWNGDGTPDLMVRDASGHLYLYPFLNGRFLAETVVGSGWDFTHYFVGNWAQDGTPDLLVRDTNGTLYLYPFDNGRFGASTAVGSGWHFTTYSVANWVGDKTPDLLVRDGAGNQYVYPFSGGRFLERYAVGIEPGVTHDFPADWITDEPKDPTNRADLIMRTSNGDLFLREFSRYFAQ